MKKEVLNENRVYSTVATNRALSVAHCALIRKKENKNKKNSLGMLFLQRVRVLTYCLSMEYDAGFWLLKSLGTAHVKDCSA